MRDEEDGRTVRREAVRLIHGRHRRKGGKGSVGRCDKDVRVRKGGTEKEEEETRTQVNGYNRVESEKSKPDRSKMN